MSTTDLMTLGAVLAAGVGIVAGATVERVRPPGRARTVLEAVAVVGAVGAVLLATAVVTIALGVSSRWFTLAHVAYLGLVVSAPLLGCWLLVGVARRRRRWGTAVLAVLLLVPVPVGWYATHWAPYAVRVSRATVELPPERTGRRPIRVGVLSDLQTNRIGSYEQRAVRLLEAQDPDVILIPGDLFQGDERQFAAILPAYRALLGSLHAPHGVYAVPGDSETVERLGQLTEGTGVVILDDRIVTLRIGDRTVRLGGNKLRWAPPEGVAVRRELAASPPGDVRILMAHRPEVVLGLPPSSGVDLVVAGHTHGGQVALPLLGPLVTQSPVSRSVAAGGLHQVAGNPIYVSTGAGMVRQQAPQVRFLTRPSVGLVTLR